MRSWATVAASWFAAFAACSSPSTTPSDAPVDGGLDEGGLGSDGALGGDGGPPAVPLYVSGARLKARFNVTTDGPTVFRDWRDTRDGSGCRFVPASDGKIRCLPYGTQITYFADDACTKPLVGDEILAGSCQGSAPKYASTFDTTACTPRFALYEVGAKVATTTIYYKGDAGTCTGTIAGPSGHYEVGAEIPPATFVATVEEVGADLGGIVRVDLVAEDGARGFAGFRDLGRNVGCHFERAGDGAVRCLPLGTLAATVASGQYANAACTERVAQAYTTGPQCAASAATEDTFDGCSYARHVYEVGAPATSAYSKSDATCTAVPPSGGSAYFTVGTEIAASSLIDGHVAAVGTSRIKVRMLNLKDGAYPFKDELFDSERNESCSFSVAGDGVVRCLANSPARAFFADAACTQRLATVDAQVTTCGDKATTVRFADPTTCPMQTRLFSVGAQVTPPSLFGKRDDGSCAVVSIGAGATFYEAGAEIAPSSFVAVSEVEY